MPRWVKDNSLLIVNLFLFLFFWGGMAITGWYTYNEEQLSHGQSPIAFPQFFGTGEFFEATFENWESEFLQMGMYVVLTAFLFQKGSAESKPIDEPAPQDEDPRDKADDPRAPWPVRRGGMVLKVYENSLSILFLVLFLLSVVGHAVGGAAAYSEEQAQHGEPPVSAWEYLGISQFWFESFQNWQSEFMVVAVIVWATVYLRQRASSQSKPVAAPYDETGA